jgi:hypothetical protein
MGGTDLVDEASGSLAEDAPVPGGRIRLGDLRAFQVSDDEDDAVLVVSDGDTTIEFSCGLSGHTDASADGARRLVEALGSYLEDLESRRP